MKIKTKNVLTGAMILLMVSGMACAISIGVSPSTLRFEDVIRGGYAEGYFTLSTSGMDNLSCSVTVSGPVKSWISMDAGNSFILPAQSGKVVKVILQPPVDAASGTYEGKINVNAAPTMEIQSGAGLAVGAGVEIKVKVTVTGEEIIAYSVEGVSVQDTEIDYPIKFGLTLLNKGNTRVSPPIQIDILDKVTGITKKTFTYNQAEVLPTKRQTVSFDVPSTGLDVGAYEANIKVESEEHKVIFNVMPKGTLALQGRLMQVEVNKVWVDTGETVKLTAMFRNEGEVMIQGAKFVGEAYLIDEKYQTEKLMKTFESEKMDVSIGEDAELSSYFKPEQEGRYRIRGEVIYSGKKTPSKETILNVNPRPTNYLPYYIAIGLIVILIVYYLVRKGEDGRTRRFRKIWGDYLNIK